jgi:hypothetical protein
MMGRRPGYMSQRRDAYEPLTSAMPTFSLGGLPDSLIRKVLAHPHRGHSLEPPETLGASFLGEGHELKNRPGGAGPRQSRDYLDLCAACPRGDEQGASGTRVIVDTWTTKFEP